jgi:hypothetical protein
MKDGKVLIYETEINIEKITKMILWGSEYNKEFWIFKFWMSCMEQEINLPTVKSFSTSSKAFIYFIIF